MSNSQQQQNVYSTGNGNVGSSNYIMSQKNMILNENKANTIMVRE